MRLLRSPPGIRVVPRAVVDAHAQAAAVVAAAQADADGLRDAARRDADAIRDEARRRGEADARAEANAVLAQAAAHRAREAERDAGTIAELAVEVARTVLGREAASGPEVLRDVARRALARVRRARRVVLRVHPDDLDLTRAACREWLAAGHEPDVVDAEADPSVERGGVVVESEVGRLDARLETQLDAIRRALGTPAEPASPGGR